MASSSNETVINKFVKAVSNGKLKHVKRLESELNEKGLLVANVKDCNGRSALHIAALGGNIPISKYLIEQLKLDVNIKDQEEKTPLHHAVLGGHLPTVKYLLELGADPNKSDGHKLTALHLAAMKGHTELILLLITKGAVVDAQSDNGSPLVLASSSGNHDAVKILLEHNANPDNYALTPLVTAIITRSYERVRALLEAGVDPNVGPCGVTPIEIAVFEGEVEITKCLLEEGANPNVVNMHNESPIQTAALHQNRELVELLLPVTTRNPKVEDWSYLGLIKYVNSNEVRVEKEMERRAYFIFSKLKGKEEVKRKNYQLAIFWYTEALDANLNDPLGEAIILSNRSLCYAKMNEGVDALSDAMKCLRLRPDWPKAYYRAGVALNLLNRYHDAANSFRDGLKLDPKNKELEDAFWNAALAEWIDMSI